VADPPTTAEVAALRRLAASEEGQYFDRKSLYEGRPGEKRAREKRKVRDQVVEYVAAFANADGGTLVLGVEDDGSLTGCPHPEDEMEKILRSTEARLTPPQRAGRVVEVDGAKLLVFDVVPAPRAVMVQGDGFPRRDGDSVVQSSEEVINRIKDAGLVTSPEARVARAELGDLDELAIKRAMDAGGFGGSVEDYLAARRLADRRGDVLALRQGAVWLFAKTSGAIEHPNLGVRVFRVHGAAQTTGTTRNVQDFPWIEGNLVEVLEKARDRVASLIRASSRLHDLFFKETPEYPPLAWQEALVNALAHRDYAIEGRCVEVWLYDDRLEVKSPGALLPDVRLDDLLERHRVHASRNPRIARVLTELGVMRQQGEGIPRMIEEMELSWLPIPELVATEREFRVVLRNEPVFAGTDETWTAYVRELPLEVRQKRALVVLADREFKSGEYQELNRVDRDAAYRELNDLVSRGLLRSIGDRAATRYAVTRPTLPAPRAATPEQKLRARMEAAGLLTNADYRDAFGVGRVAAKQALLDLVRLGVLELRGERRGAHYVPGAGWGGFGGGS
jgi:ATP-dependent DNA helicase RecG